MSELVDFLRARLDEDATEIAKHPDGEDDWEFVATGETNYPCTPYLMIGKKRALAEVGAKRRLLDEYAEYEENDTDKRYEYADGWANGLGFAVRLLALPYSDHADYRADWAV